MAEDEVLRAHFQKMRQAFEAPRTREPVEAPADIRETIHREIEAVAEVTPEHPVRRPRRGRNWSPQRLGARQLLTAAAVAAVALVVVMIPRGEEPNEASPENAVGSLLPLDATGPVADRWIWTEPWGQTEAALLSREGGWDLRVDVRSNRDAIVTIEFNPVAWEITGLDSELPLPAEPRAISGRYELSTGPRNGVVVGIRPIEVSGAEAVFRVRVSTLDGSRTGELTGAPIGEIEKNTTFPD